MKKIPSLFVRDWDGDRSLVTREVDPECQWVIDGEGMATIKWDGTSCLIRNRQLFKRYTLRKGRVAPEGFEPATGVDPNTGKQQGWVPVGDGPEDKYHRQAIQNEVKDGIWPLPDGTYELVGPKIQGGAEADTFEIHVLVGHGDAPLPLAPRDYDQLKQYLHNRNYEGIVWHHPDGRMAKIKKSDFGLER